MKDQPRLLLQHVALKSAQITARTDDSAGLGFDIHMQNGGFMSETEKKDLHNIEEIN